MGQAGQKDKKGGYEERYLPSVRGGDRGIVLHITPDARGGREIKGELTGKKDRRPSTPKLYLKPNLGVVVVVVCWIALRCVGQALGSGCRTSGRRAAASADRTAQLWVFNAVNRYQTDQSLRPVDTAVHVHAPVD